MVDLPSVTGTVRRVGGLVRCVACGEVQWNLRFGANSSPDPACRICGEELRVERRRFGRSTERAKPDRRMPPLPADGGGLRGGATAS
jgi:hypothetical protein